MNLFSNQQLVSPRGTSLMLTVIWRHLVDMTSHCSLCLLLSSMAVSSAAVDMSVFFCLPVLSIAFELSGKKFINLPFNLPRICHLSFDFQRV